MVQGGIPIPDHTPQLYSAGLRFHLSEKLPHSVRNVSLVFSFILIASATFSLFCGCIISFIKRFTLREFLHSKASGTLASGAKQGY